MKTYQNFINGKWVSAKSGGTFPDRNPADWKETLGTFQRSNRVDIDAAVRAAENALPEWMAMPAPKRGEILFKSAQILENKKETLAQIMTREMGKSLRESRADAQEAIDTAYYFAGEGRRLVGQTVPSELKNKMCLVLRRPVGVCGLITPWNFPLAIPSWKVYPALICGNTVVLKPAEDTPFMSILFAEIMQEAGLPDGVLNVVTGLGLEAGRALVSHPDVALISFTGSSAVGAEIASICGKNLKRCSLEMGGKNAEMVMPDADMDLAVEAALWGAFATSGQRCTATSRIILHEKIAGRFLRAFLPRVKKCELGPIINQKQLKQIHRHVTQAKKEGAVVLTGGAVDRMGEKRNGFFYRPTVLTRVSGSMRIAREEVFGPVVCLMKVKNYEEAITLANNTGYGLSSSIFTRNVSLAMKSLNDIQTGITYVNSSTIGAEAHLPFGGVKRTGNGHREGGAAALDIFSEWKTVYIDTSGRLQKAQMD